MDIRLPDLSGIDVMIAIRAEFPEARIIMLTTFEGGVEVRRALDAGACGYLLKNMTPTDLSDEIRRVHAGETRIPPGIAVQFAGDGRSEGLTPMEIEVLQQAALGNGDRDIARSLNIAEGAVKAQVKHLMDKLGAKDRAQAITIAARRGIVRL
jgi:DNA-binding NarL/FixJ family response regulator